MAYAVHLLEHRDPIVTPIALGLGAAASVATAGYTIYQGEKQSDRAEDAMDAQANEQKRLRSEMEERQKQEDASVAAREARDRTRLNTSKLGRKSAMFTGPQGIPQIGGYGGGTFLGGGKP
jgi:hypothetical protein